MKYGVDFGGIIMKNNITPIFILGGARNGTTWLCNTLGNHSEIASVRHVLHHGFHESSIFRKKQFFGDIKNDKKFIEFIEVFANSDHFILANGDKEYFYKNRPKDFYEFFFQLMDNYATKQNKRFWLTKFDPSLLMNNNETAHFFERLNKRYSSFKLISIQRNFEDVIRSYLNMPGTYYKYRHSKTFCHIAAFKEAAQQNFLYKKINKLKEKYEIFSISFEDMKNNFKSIMENCMHFLELKYEENLEKRYFKPNTSFTGNKRKIDITTFEKKLFKWVTKPRFISKTLLYLWEKKKGIPDTLFFRLKRADLFPRNLVEEFEEQGEFDLAEIVKKEYLS